MAVEIRMPALSPTMEEGTLAKWLVAEGDEVRSGDVIAEIETDKATMEVEAVDDGRVGTLLVAAGAQNVKVNAPIAILLAEGEAAGTTPTPEAPTPEAPEHPHPKHPHPKRSHRRQLLRRLQLRLTGPGQRPMSPCARLCVTRWLRKCAAMTMYS
jgi:pyruvate/2-oxoglutarate dehydrogenase complex dihydrolipoamide acyltransferase (E2) component